MQFKAFSILKKDTIGSPSGFSLGDIIGIKDKTQEKQNNFEKNYRKAFQTGIYNLIQFTGKKCLDMNNFDMATDNFTEAIKLKPNKPEPYFYLAWLFTMVSEKETAAKYMKIAAHLNPSLEGLAELREEIFKH